MPSPSSCASPDDFTSDITFPISDDANATISDKHLTTNNIAELPITDFDILPLPELPFDDMFTAGWTILEETVNDQPAAVVCVTESSNGALDTVQLLDSSGDMGHAQFQTLNHFSIENAPLLAASDEENQTEGVPLFLCTSKAEGCDRLLESTDGTAITHQAPPVSPHSVLRHRSIDVSDKAEIDCSTTTSALNLMSPSSTFEAELPRFNETLGNTPYFFLNFPQDNFNFVF